MSDKPNPTQIRRAWKYRVERSADRTAHLQGRANAVLYVTDCGLSAVL